MNVSAQLISLKSQQISQYSGHALNLYLQKNQDAFKKLTHKQKIIVTKIYKNLNILCKVTKKQLKQLFKQSKQLQQYQQIIGQLFFTPKINNYILINKQEQNVKIDPNVLRKTQSNSVCAKNNNNILAKKCIKIDYRLQFTISNINKKKVMKPVILIIYYLEDNSTLKVYYSIEQFNNLRYEVSQNMKKIYGIQLRTMF